MTRSHRKGRRLRRDAAFGRSASARIFHSLLALVLVLMVPAVAWACPACVGQQDRFSFALKALGLMILFPFMVAWLVIRAIRNASRDDEDSP